jgi:hypothetical protein
MEETITNAVSDTGVQDTQPASTDTSAEAVTTTTEQTTQDTTNEPQQTNTELHDNSIDGNVDDNSKWLASKGIDPSDPEAINKLAKSAREAERAMHLKAQKASELEKSMTQLSDDSIEQYGAPQGSDPELLKRVQRFEIKDTIREFFDANPEAKQYEQKMIDEMTTSGLMGSPEAMLKAAYAIAKSSSTPSDSSSVQRQTLENLAQKQQAAVPTGNATTAGISSQKITSSNVDQLVAKNDLAWFKKHYDEINQAMAS